MKRIPLVTVTTCILLCCSHALALDIASTMAGTLSQKNISAAESSLKVSGPVNAADLYYIGDRLGGLDVLDLSEAVIEAYAGPMLHRSETYAEGVIPPLAFSGLSAGRVVLPAGQRLTIADGAFAGSGIRSIDLTQVDSAGYGAFATCTSLTEVTLTTARVGKDAFKGCTALARADVSGLRSIPAGAFAGCTSLSEVSGTAGIGAVGDAAFQGCTSLREYDFGDAVSEIGARAFEFSGLSSADLSGARSLRSIGERAFASCPALASARLPHSVTAIGDGAFFEDAALTDINLPSRITALPERVFKGARNLVEIHLTEDIATIGKFAMKDVTKVRTLRMPAALDSVGDFAMEGMTGLEAINAHALTAVPATGTDVWRGVDQPAVTLHVAPGYAEMFRNAGQWADFTFDESGADKVLADSDATLGARFEGNDLIVECTGHDIESLSLYDLSGRLLAALRPAAQTVTIPTGDFDGSIFVLTAGLTDGRRASLKTVRK